MVRHVAVFVVKTSTLFLVPQVVVHSGNLHTEGVLPSGSGWQPKAVAGSFARNAEDLILLDSIVRAPNCTTTSMGALPAPVSCAPNVTKDLNLTGLRLGLPSTFGWAQGISSEARLHLKPLLWIAIHFHSPTG